MNDSSPPYPVPPGSTRSSLLRRVQGDEQRAWDQLVDQYGPLVYHWCRRPDLSPEDTDDLFQEVFRAVARGIKNFHKNGPDATFRGWLRTITQNKIRDHFRRRGPVLPAKGGSSANEQLAQVPVGDNDPDDSSEANPEVALLHRVLALIRPEFEERTWQAFWRNVMEGKEPAKIAPALKMSLNSVHQAKVRVLRRLREELT